MSGNHPDDSWAVGNNRILYSGTVSGMIVSAVDLFCGIGGLTYGLSKSGVAVRAGFDNDISCRFAYETNNLQSEFYNADVRDVCSADIAPHYEGADVTVMVGCAPCQPFSSHTRKTRIPDDEDCSLVDDFARLVKECEPDIVSMENVPGLAKHQAFYRLLRTLRHLEYEYQCEVISCIKYGVPQTRRRLVLLASRLGTISLPRPMENRPIVADFISALPVIEDGKPFPSDPIHTTLRLSSQNRDRIRQSVPGGTWKDWDDAYINRCHRRAYYPASYGRMKWDSPAPTITTQFCYYSTGRFGHPEQDRTISVREGALLQTFPPGYQLVDSDDEIVIHRLARHVGNAVPVKLAEAIGKCVMEVAANGR